MPDPLTPELARLRHDLHGWLRGAARRRRLDHVVEDLLATADLALMEARRDHDPQRGPLGPWVRLHVRRRTLRLLDADRRLRRLRARLEADTHAEACVTTNDPLCGALGRRLAGPTADDRLALAHALHEVPVHVLAAERQLSYHRARRAVLALRDAAREAAALHGANW